MTLLVSVVKILVLALLGSPEVVSTKGLATRFGDPGDPLDGNRLSCLHRPMQKDDFVCAHRTLPCGTPVVVQNPRTGKLAVCTVADRGPYGAILDGEWVFKFTRRDPGIWRGIIDLSPAVANALAFNGREPVRVFHSKQLLRRGRALHVRDTAHRP
jgi:hypothetical protein